MKCDKKHLPFVTVRYRRDFDPVTRLSHVVEIVDTSEFDRKMLAHLAARAKHRFTVGEPAPFPEHEMLRTVCEAIERGESFELEHAEQFLCDWEYALAVDAVRAMPDTFVPIPTEELKPPAQLEIPPPSKPAPGVISRALDFIG